MIIFKTVEDVFNEVDPKSDTWITIRDQILNKLAVGNWYEDKILDYADSEVTSFTWQNDNSLIIDIDF